MPASTIGDRRHILFDKSLELRDRSAAAISATTSETAIAFSARKEQSFECVVDVAAHTGYSAGSALWTLTVEVCDTASGTFVIVGTVQPTGVAKRFQLPLSGQWIAQLKSDAAFIRVTATKTSTPGNLSYGAFLNYSC